MKLTHLAAGAALGALLSGAPAVLAASNSEVQGVESAKVTMPQAIMAAQKLDKGHAIFAKYTAGNNLGKYVVTVVRPNGKKDTVKVDAQTGRAMNTDQTTASNNSQAGARTIEQAKVGLSQAIQTAESKGNGRAMRATLDTENGKTAYKVELASGNNATHTVWIDANSGSVLNHAS